MITFDSGLKLVVAPNPAVRSVSAGVFVGAGSVYETPEQSGISHFIEHMMFKGTESRSAFDIANEIDSLGAQINAYTAKSNTCYYTLSRDVHAAECLDVLSDMYFNALFDPSELKKERKVVLEELNESEDTPDDLCMEKLSSAFFKGHPLEKPILGSRKSLNGLSASDLHAYKNAFYVPGGTVISLAGNITASEAVRLTERYFESKFSSSAQSPRKRLEKAPMKGAFSHAKKEIEQAHIAFAFPGAAYNTDDALSSRLLAAVFGLEMSSRLFQSVRERLGLCYSIMGYPTAYENNGAFIIYTSMSPDSGQRATCNRHGAGAGEQFGSHAQFGQARRDHGRALRHRRADSARGVAHGGGYIRHGGEDIRFRTRFRKLRGAGCDGRKKDDKRSVTKGGIMSDKTKGVDNEFFKGEDMSGMDKLDIIFAMQEKFDQDVIKNRGLQGVTPEEWIQKQTLAMLSELAELIAEVNFKWWKNPKPVVTDNVREELVDILHFFVGMCNRSGMGSEELFARYIKKNEENFKRQYGMSAKPGYSLFGESPKQPE